MNEEEKPEEVPVLGFLGNSTAIMGDAATYARLRAELFLIESKEAGTLLGKKVAMMVVAAFLALVTYVLALFVFAKLIGYFLEKSSDTMLSNWFGGAAILAVLHLLLAIILFLLAAKKKTAKLFEYTISEWEKDRQWMHTKKKS